MTSHLHPTNFTPLTVTVFEKYRPSVASLAALSYRISLRSVKDYGRYGYRISYSHK